MKLAISTATAKRLKAWGSGWWGSVYDSVNHAPHRQNPPGSRPRDAKFDLTPSIRGEQVRRSRYINKNSGFSRELVSNMAIYSVGTGIKPKARTVNLKWNEAAEQYFARWSRRCDITGRYTYGQAQSLVCRGMDVDGEYFVAKVADEFELPKLQLIESHRVKDKDIDGILGIAETPQGIPTGDTVDGIGFNKVGAPTFYRVQLDDGTFDDVDAAHMMHVYEPENASAVRVGPVGQHSINHILDEMELIALEKHAVKDGADISRVITRGAGATDDTDFNLGRPADGGLSTDPVTLQQIVGGKAVSLQEGEKIDQYVSARPSPTFTGFLEHLRRDSALGHMPYEFAADSREIGGAGVRLVVAKADRRFEWRTYNIQEKFVYETWLFVIGHAIHTKRLTEQVGWNDIDYTSPRRVTVDAGREARENRADVEGGLKTLETHYTEQGQDFLQQLEVRAQNAKAIVDAATRYGVPLSMLWNPQGGTDATGAVGEPVNNAPGPNT